MTGTVRSPSAGMRPTLADPDAEFDDFPPEEMLPPDFTFRAVGVGLLVGVILCMTNVYFGLQTGWVSMMAPQSALLGFAVFKFLPKILPKIMTNPFTPQENVILQTTAVATGTMPLAAGLVGIIPALEMMTVEEDGWEGIKLSFGRLILWCLAVAFFGVFLAAPLRRQVIVKEKLVFPSGTATAQLIALLHKVPPPAQSLNATNTSGGPAYRRLPRTSRSVSPAGVDLEDELDLDDRRIGVETRLEKDAEVLGGRGWWALGWSFLASGSYTLFSFLIPVLYAIPIFDIFGAPFGTSLAANWMWWFTPSLSYVGQGIIMGFPVTLSMNAGMIVGWAVLSPLSKHMGWAPGRVSSTTDGGRGWILWVALAIMIAESIISLLPIILSYTTTVLRHHKQRSTKSKVFQAPSSPSETRVGQDDYFDPPDEEDDEDPENEPPERLVPTQWVTWGLAGSAVLGVVLVWVVFGADGIHPWATAVGLVLASALSLIGVRALGETDINPVSGIGKISQLLFAVLQPGNAVANIIAGGVAEAGAMQAGDLMQDLKTGHLLGASPRSQFYGQMIGSLASVFVSTAGYKFYTSVYQIPGPEFAVPSAGVWLSLARLLNHGHLPSHVVPFMLAFGIIFGTLSFVKSFRTRLPLSPTLDTVARNLPSGIAFAVGFLNGPSFSIARLIGGYIAYRSAKASGTGETPLLAIVVASGFVLGEGVFSIVTLVLTSMGYGAVSCFGCGLGGGGYCSGTCG